MQGLDSAAQRRVSQPAEAPGAAAPHDPGSHGAHPPPPRSVLPGRRRRSGTGALLTQRRGRPPADSVSWLDACTTLVERRSPTAPPHDVRYESQPAGTADHGRARPRCPPLSRSTAARGGGAVSAARPGPHPPPHRRTGPIPALPPHRGPGPAAPPHAPRAGALGGPLPAGRPIAARLPPTGAPIGRGGGFRREPGLVAEGRSAKGGSRQKPGAWRQPATRAPRESPRDSPRATPTHSPQPPPAAPPPCRPGGAGTPRPLRGDEGVPTQRGLLVPGEAPRAAPRLVPADPRRRGAGGRLVGGGGVCGGSRSALLHPAAGGRGQPGSPTPAGGCPPFASGVPPALPFRAWARPFAAGALPACSGPRPV